MYGTHLYAAGRTGSGKSTWIGNHALDNESGFIFIDPHGQEAERLADTTDCIYLDAGDTAHPFGFNVLHNVREEDKHLVVESVIAGMQAIWWRSWGQNLEDVLRNSLYLLIDNPNTSLKDITILLSDQEYRTRLLRNCHNEEIRHFWEVEFEDKSNKQKAEETRSTTNRIRSFVSNPVLRNILSHHTVNMEHIMNAGKRCVISLAKGKLGDAPSRLLGSLIVSTIGNIALRRENLSVGDRVRCTLYVDEFQTYISQSFINILSEARKYQLFLVMANQYLKAIPEEIQHAIFANIGYLVVFRVSSLDAPAFARQLGFLNPNSPTPMHDENAWVRLVNLPPFTAYARNGDDPHLIQGDPPYPRRGRLAANRRNTRARYTRKRFQVERWNATVS